MEDLHWKIKHIKDRADEISDQQQLQVEMWTVKFDELIEMVIDLNIKLKCRVNLKQFRTYADQLVRYRSLDGYNHIKNIFEYSDAKVLQYAPKIYQKFMKKITMYVNKHFEEKVIPQTEYCVHCGTKVD